MNALIQITGKKRHGKDTVTNMLLNQIDRSYRFAFADSMKYILAETLGITVNELEELKNDDTKPHREYLQRFGQKAKGYFGEECWKNIVKKEIASLPKNATAIVSDTRYPVELFGRAIVVKVVNPRIKSTDAHSSETLVEEIKADYIIYNDGTLEDLELKVSHLVNEMMVKGELPKPRSS